MASSAHQFESIDHLVLLSPSASAAKKYLQDVTGVVPEYGGEHPGVGTCNYLLSLGNRQYLEIIAPSESTAPASATVSENLLSICSSLSKPVSYAFCIASNNLEAVAAVLSDSDIAFTGPLDMERHRPDGVKLKWQLLTCFDSQFGPALPFFIHWKECPHPATEAPSGCSFVDFYVAHPNCRHLSAVFDKLGLEIPTVESDVAEIKFVLDTPKGQIAID